MQQLSPEGQDLLMQSLSEMGQTESQQTGQQSAQAQVAPEDQYVPPQQRMGGLQNKGFNMLPKYVQEKIMRSSK